MKTCKFIESDKGEIFVPRPTSVGAGMSRSIWLKSFFGKKTVIASPTYWQDLISKYGNPRVLIEEEGTFRIEET